MNLALSLLACSFLSGLETPPLGAVAEAAAETVVEVEVVLPDRMPQDDVVLLRAFAAPAGEEIVEQRGLSTVILVEAFEQRRIRRSCTLSIYRIRLGNHKFIQSKKFWLICPLYPVPHC